MCPDLPSNTNKTIVPFVSALTNPASNRLKSRKHHPDYSQHGTRNHKSRM
uniref:Uncharacterized protein n=1 Tax=Arundo donax TaxID=35708 RepID=A0A0A9CIP1_ARUDO